MADANKRTRRVARFYHAENLSDNSDLQLDKTSSHHLLTVLRARPGDVLTIFNGDGYEYQATLQADTQRGSNRQARLRIGERKCRNTESPLSIKLLQCVSRADRMEITIRQAVESGVTHIQPVHSRHSANIGDEKRIQKKQNHWQSVITSAVEQCGRSVLPVLSELKALPEVLQDIHSSIERPTRERECRLVLSPTADTSISEYISHLKLERPTINSAMLIIGPESGLDADEIALAQDNSFKAVHVGPRILRTETAGPACIVLLQALLGDLQAP